MAQEDGRAVYGTRGRSYVSNTVSDHGVAHFGDVFNQTTILLQRTSPVGAVAVADAILGLDLVTASLQRRLKEHIRPIQHTGLSPLATDMFNSLTAFKSVLSELRTRVTRAQMDFESASDLRFYQLATSCTSAVLLLDELQAVLDPVLTCKSTWQEQRKVLRPLLLRMEQQTALWRTHLDAVESVSTLEAFKSSCHLDDQISQLLADHADLKARMEAMEDRLDGLYSVDDQAESELRAPKPSNVFAAPILARRLSNASTVPSFQGVLATSRVYQRFDQRSGVFSCSMLSSAQRSYAWLDLDRFSAARISVLSVIALPIEPSDLLNGTWYEPSVESSKHDDQASFQPSSPDPDSTITASFSGAFETPFICVSIFECTSRDEQLYINQGSSKHPHWFHSYTAGETFTVVECRGPIWLARKGTNSGSLGCIFRYEFKYLGPILPCTLRQYSNEEIRDGWKSILKKAVDELDTDDSSSTPRVEDKAYTSDSESSSGESNHDIPIQTLDDNFTTSD